MLTNILKKNKIRKGLNTIVSSKDAKYIQLKLSVSNAGQISTHKINGYETVLVILKGQIKVNINQNFYALKRKDVFKEKATALYIPINTKFTIKYVKDSEVALCQAKAKIKKLPIHIKQNNIEIIKRGKTSFERIVYNISDEKVDTDRIFVGETVNLPGNWSGYPPHKHDKDNLPYESNLEEVYLFKISPEQGFGIQKIYTYKGRHEIDNLYTVQNNDVVIVKKGYHPVVAAPGYKLYYLWILAGRKKILAPYLDEKHAWIENINS